MSDNEWAICQLAYAIVLILVAALIGGQNKPQPPEQPVVAIESQAE